MRARSFTRKLLLALIVGAGSLLLGSGCASARVLSRTDPFGATAASATPPLVTPLDQTAEVRALVESVRALQAQVEALNLQVSELREEQERAREQAIGFPGRKRSAARI